MISTTRFLSRRSHPATRTRGLFAWALLPVLALVPLLAGCAHPETILKPTNPETHTSGPKVDDWQYDERSVARDGVSNIAQSRAAGGAIAPLLAPMAAKAAPQQIVAESVMVGFSAGGAKDIANFRENLRNGYLPLPTDIPYEGLFYDYYFDTGATAPCTKLFCPSYVAATSRDPFSGRPDLYLSVGLNSGLDAARFSRKRLNLVVVLDISGSMSSPFDRYYYDRFGNRQEADAAERGRTKIEVATASIVSLISHLGEGDRLGIVLFNGEAYLAKPMRAMAEIDRERLASHILAIRANGSTNMEAGIRLGTDLLQPFAGADREQYENRIVFLTDAMPNTGEIGTGGLVGMTGGNAARSIFTTFIGIGVDFNTELVADITKIRGANYYAVHSAADFKKRLDEEFDFMVTPLVFDLALTLETTGYEIVKVYGSPDANESTGEIMKVRTLFPSKVEDGRTRGGVILLKLRRVSGNARLALRASWEDRSGRRDGRTSEIDIPSVGTSRYPNTGIRKAILLSRYADVLLNWIVDAGRSRTDGQPIVASITAERGIPCPDFRLGRWERRSIPLKVSAEYRDILSRFRAHFREEASALNDSSLSRELDVLDALVKKDRD
jgi:Ca-activated chloride channel family protein